MIAMAMVPPLSALVRAAALGVIGCAGLAYVLNLTFALTHLARRDERELLWDILLPLASYALLVIAAAACAIEAASANLFAATGAVILLVVSLRKSWVVTLVIASRRRKDASGK